MSTPTNLTTHWNHVYATKRPDQVSWTQDVPRTSLAFLDSFGLSSDAHILDIGGGDSHLVDFLLDAGFTRLSVLDISGQALARAQARLGTRADAVTWIECDVLRFEPTEAYDVWHDRATFHFLTEAPAVARYLALARQAVQPAGYLTMGTFSTNGPTSCSGLPVRQYDEQALTDALAVGFAKIRCLTEDHVTPFQTRQNFLFCSFRRETL